MIRFRTFLIGALLLVLGGCAFGAPKTAPPPEPSPPGPITEAVDKFLAKHTAAVTVNGVTASYVGVVRKRAYSHGGRGFLDFTMDNVRLQLGLPHSKQVELIAQGGDAGQLSDIGRGDHIAVLWEDKGSGDPYQIYAGNVHIIRQQAVRLPKP
jgi:hypothetical protein